jgi:hypothetical protein
MDFVSSKGEEFEIQKNSIIDLCRNASVNRSGHYFGPAEWTRLEPGYTRQRNGLKALHE